MAHCAATGDLADAAGRDQIVMGDVGVKVMLVSDGGWGYGHLLREVVPLMRLYGVTDEHVKALMVENPLRLLTITKEQ